MAKRLPASAVTAHANFSEFTQARQHAMPLIRAVSSPAALKPVGLRALRALRSFAAWCARCHARAEQRKRLAELDEAMLRDIGITPAEAARESAKPWWRA